MQRLDKFLCDCGVGTRSQVKVMLKAGRITVNDRVVKDGSLKLDEQTARVCLDGQEQAVVGQLVVMLNKPAGYITATKDDKDPTVMDLLPAQYKSLKPVGRLDKETEGLLLFTNDGDLLHRLISPKKEVAKVYYARHEGTAQAADVTSFRDGLTLKDGTQCLPAVLEPIGPGESLITVWEGKYHQVRRMMASRGMPVTYLERRQEGNLALGALPRGQIRPLTAQEVSLLTK